MRDLIDREAILEMPRRIRMKGFNYEESILVEDIEKLPTVDAVPLSVIEDIKTAIPDTLVLSNDTNALLQHPFLYMQPRC